MTKSQTRYKRREEVYEWIDHLQKNPTDDAVQESMINTYKNLVGSLARKYSNNSGNHEDLVQVGMIGLLGAVSRFDPNFGKTFESFAIPTILGEIKRYLRDQTWSIHVPRRIKELGPKIKKAVDELTNMNQKDATVLEIAEYLDVSEEEVLETMEIGRSYRALSVDRNIQSGTDGGMMTLLDVVGDKENSYEHIDQKMLLEQILPVLSEREQSILKCTFFENMSQKETGELLGISQMHVSRVQRGALIKLREALPFDDLKDID